MALNGITSGFAGSLLLAPAGTPPSPLTAFACWLLAATSGPSSSPARPPSPPHTFFPSHKRKSEQQTLLAHSMWLRSRGPPPPCEALARTAKAARREYAESHRSAASPGSSSEGSLLLSLPPDLLRYVLFADEGLGPTPLLDRLSLLVCRCVCRQLRALISAPRPRSDCRIEHLASHHGQLTILQWSYSQGAAMTESLVLCAAEQGHLSVLQWLRANGAPWHPRTCPYAAQGGHLDVLRWARANGAPCSYLARVCEAAAQKGHLRIVQWARRNNVPWGSSCASAALGGQLAVLRWARRNGAPWDEGTCWFAALCGHTQLLKWARSNGAPWQREACLTCARRGGFVEMEQWILTQPA
jgi:hypothetical protein